MTKFILFFRCIALLGLAIVATACTDIVTLDLKNTDPIVVIEAELLSDTAIQVIRISKSTGFYDTIAPPAVLTAAVSVADDLGNTYAFTHINNGIYACPNLLPVVGRTYTLSVTEAAKTYTATTRMMLAVPIDSLSVSKVAGGGFGPPGSGGGGDGGDYQVLTHFTDPLTSNNSYRLRYFKGRNKDEVIFDDNRFGNGGNISVSPFGTSLAQNDTLHVELQALDREVYSYFDMLSQLAGGQGGQLASPANPTTNISGNALGYFGIFNRSRKSIIIQ